MMRCVKSVEGPLEQHSTLAVKIPPFQAAAIPHFSAIFGVCMKSRPSVADHPRFRTLTTVLVRLFMFAGVQGYALVGVAVAALVF